MTKSITDVDLDEFSVRMAKESDRACAIVSAALVDAKLEVLFRVRLLAEHDGLLGPAKALGDFGTRILLAHALGWISADARADLNQVRKVRNEFAHSFDHELTFDDARISNWCRELKTAKAYLDGFEVAASRPGRNISSQSIYAMRDATTSSRWRYMLTTDFLSQYLDDARSAPTETVDLLGVVRALSANTRIVAAAMGTVG